jgi:spore coat polysaccharide biosynthesis protein SpsF
MIAVFIQARASSSRFPGKVLKPILGKPMLQLEIERVLSCRMIDRVVVVTSTCAQDRQIVDIGKSINVDVFCGSLENVLDRFYQAAVKFKPDHIVRLTGDCPLIDAKVIDDMVRLYLDKKCDYGTNCMPPTYPDGLDAEIFSFQALQQAKQEAVLPSHLEHISVFFEEQPQRFKIVNLAYPRDLSGLRWTVDVPQDLEFVKIIFETLYPVNPLFDMDDVLDLLKKKPELSLLNNYFIRNEGLLKSKEKDRAFLEEGGMA